MKRKVEGKKIAITDTQRAAHLASETLGVATAPFILLAAAKKGLPTWLRVILGLIGAGTIAVDAAFIRHWSKLIEEEDDTPIRKSPPLQKKESKKEASSSENLN